MTPRILGLFLLLGLLALPAASALGGHYVPKPGDRFTYTETVVLNNGTGDNYTGYTENTFVNGSVSVTAVFPNGTESASYRNSDSWQNNQGAKESWTSAGDFTFSAADFQYVNGTDNQTGYTSPVFVWFYMNNSLPVGGTFYVLNTGMTVESVADSYELGTGHYVKTIYAQGTGSYERDDVYGVFTASYTWKEYFDPGTGYIVGYQYVERDTNPDGNGFTWTDTLYVTNTTYALTPASGPSTTTSASLPWTEIVVLVVVVLIIIIVVIALWARSRARPRIPQHGAPGAIGYGPPPVPPPYAGGAPPVQLTPSQQPVPQVVLRETVKVKCPYCGNLIDVTDKVCPNCGAPVA